MSSGEQFDLKIYDVYRSDRYFSMTYSNRENATSLNDSFRNIKHIEVLGIKCKINAKSDFFITVGYAPPNWAFEEYVSFIDSIASRQCLYGLKVLILDDFNIPELWEPANRIRNKV